MALTGCGERELTREEAVAQVERMSTPPVIPIEPEPIKFADIERYDLFGAGCAVVVEGEDDAIFLAQDKHGWLILNGELVELSSDRSSEAQPFETWSKYVGLKYWLTISRDSASEVQTGDEVWSAPGEIVIHDPRDRVVYRAAASIECGA